MPSFTLKNIPDDLFEQLRSTAELHRRSINSEILTCLERSLGARPIPVELVASARGVREAIEGPNLSLAELDRARAAGRP